MSTTAEPVADWAWRRQAVWSSVANGLKEMLRRRRVLRLYLIVVGGALTLAGSQLIDVHPRVGVVGTVIGAVAMALVAVLGGTETVEQVRDWTRARSVSEALKTEMYLFLTSVGKYAGPNRTQILDQEVQRLEREAGDLSRFARGVEPPLRPLPRVHDFESYLEVRADSQVEHYYAPKADLMRRRWRMARAVQVVLALVAAGIASSAIVSPSVAAWAAVATTASGAVAAFAAEERYQLLWVEYSRTADELRRLSLRRTAPNGAPLTEAELIKACEDVISVQNQGWMASWGEQGGG